MKNVLIEDVPIAKLGSVGSLDDGRKFVRFKRDLPYPIGRVWTSVTDPDRLDAWFPGFQLDRRVGGKFNIWFGGKCEGPAHVTGTVTRYKPPKVLECGNMRIELVANSSHCDLTFTDILHFAGPRSETEITNAVLGGWHKYFDMLEIALAGGKGDPSAEPELDYSKVQIDGRD